MEERRQSGVGLRFWSMRSIGLTTLLISVLILISLPSTHSYSRSRRVSSRPVVSSYRPVNVVKSKPISSYNYAKPIVKTYPISRPSYSYNYQPIYSQPKPSIYVAPQQVYTYPSYQPYQPPPKPMECKQTQGGREYKGYQMRTKSGIYCQYWSSIYPNSKIYGDGNFPEGSKSLAGSSCRNPDPLFSGGPWCHINDPKKNWELCDVPVCPGVTIPPRPQNLTSIGGLNDVYFVCNQKVCPYGSRCEYIGKFSPTDVRCVCPTQACPSTISPVCASNGVTYENECQFMKAQCDSTANVIIHHPGKCYEICKDDLAGKGYLGNLTVTRGYKSCLPWTNKYPNLLGSNSGALFPDGDVSLAGSKCRNPDPANKKFGPFCYTSAGNDWDYCDVPSCSGCQKLDIVLAIHQSTRFSLYYWHQLITELKAFVSGFNVSPDNVRFGCVTFGSKVTVNFHLNQFNTAAQIHAALDKILYTPAASNVSGTLMTIAKEILVPEKGDRAGVQNMVVMVVGERENVDTGKTPQAIKALEDSETLVFGVGLGYIDTYWLNGYSSYSSDKKRKLTHYNYDFGKMHQVLNEAAMDVCRNSPENDVECTRSAGGWDYQGSANRTKSGYLCRSWATVVPEERHQYTGSMFPDGSREAAGVNCRNPDRSFSGGPWCFTGNKNVPWELCTVSRCGDRFKPAVVKIGAAVVGGSVVDIGSLGLSSGGSEDPCKTKQCPYGSKCQRLSAAGPTATECICPTQACPVNAQEPVCGTDGVTYNNECLLMKAQCSGRQTISAADRLQVLHRGKCRCDKADIIFLLDSSGSISMTVWNRILQFVRDVTNTFNVGENTVRIGALEFSNVAKINFNLNTYKTKQEILSGIDRIRKVDGMTNTADAFYVTRTQMFQAIRGDRYDVPNIAVLITDGQSTVNTAYTLSYADELKKAGTTIISVGVQYYSSMYTNELEQVASEVNGVKQVFHINNIYNLGNLHKTLNMAVCTQASDPCLDKKCLYGAACKSEPHVDAVSPLDTQAKCVCPSTVCPNLYSPICGDDGVTYENDCALFNARCEKQKMITVARKGSCVDPCSTIKCSFGAQCSVTNDVAACVCSDICPMLYEPLCGSDGQTYGNQCQMSAASCKKKILITVRNKGVCDPCATVKCSFGSQCSVTNGLASCVCTDVCPKDFDPLCGSDGQTYSNECHMNVASCQKKIEITVKSKGLCDPCASYNCPFGAECRAKNGAATCVCPEICPSNIDMLCGNDGQSYNNECYMKKASCEKKINISIKNKGTCPQPTPVENQSKRTEYYCKSTTAGAEFKGNITTTMSGRSCQAWSKQSPNRHNYNQAALFNDGSVATAGNQCRNPDPVNKKAGPFCITTDPAVPWEYCDVPSCSGCELVDVVFILDSSASISFEYWPRALKFVKDLIKNFHYGESAARFGAVTFGYQSTIEFHLNTFNNKEATLNAVDKIGYKAESTNTSGAIWTMREKMFITEKGDRPAAQNICILITDGGSNMDEDKTIPYADEAKKAGITMFAVGVGSFIDEEELRGMASKVKGKEEVYYVSDYDTLISMRDEIPGLFVSEPPLGLRIGPCNN